jgi:hypothetical protein
MLCIVDEENCNHNGIREEINMLEEPKQTRLEEKEENGEPSMMEGNISIQQDALMERDPPRGAGRDGGPQSM